MFDLKCFCGSEPLDGWDEREPFWPLCEEHEAPVDAVDAEPDEGTVSVFVYGTLKQAYGNFQVVSDLCTKGEPGTVDGFGLVDLGAFPGAFADAECKTRGELLTLSQPREALKRLDRLEGVPTLYTRESVTVALDDGTEAEAFMYVLARHGRYPLVETDSKGASDWHPKRSLRW